MIDTSRHSALIQPDTFVWPIHVIGCGGLGSRMVEGLVRLGLGIKGKSPIHLYDGDTFEGHNVSNQWIDAAHVGKSKANRIKCNALKINSGCDISSHDFMVDRFIPLAGVVIICVDSMEARRAIMEKVIETNEAVVCVIEMRMDASTGISHCFNPHDDLHNECWWMYWYSDDEAQNMQGCGGVQSIISTIYGTAMLGLKQLEQFCRIGDTFNMDHNRIYFDFLEMKCTKGKWSTVDEE